MIKKIFIYWDKGFELAPPIVTKCVESWVKHNNDWKIILLDDNNLKQYIDINETFKDHLDVINNLTKTSYSDVIRLLLLDKYGGAWIDATVFCNRPLKWLKDTEFFMFEKPDKLPSTWFIYTGLNNYIIKEWKSSMINYIKKLEYTDIKPIHAIETLNLWKDNKYNYIHYFWVHYLFNDLLNNKIFNNLWNMTSRKNAVIPLALLFKLHEPITDEIKKILEKPPKMFKLSYKIKNQKNKTTSIINYFLSH